MTESEKTSMNYYDDSILQTLISYADNDENIRAVLMEGSRALGRIDRYSDYDIVYVTKSSEPYFDGAILPFLTENFGGIAVMQTPDNGDPHDVYTHLIQFANGIRIDLTFNSIAFLSRTPLESATVILADKDGRFADAAPSSDADFWIKQPSEEEYQKHCNQFWWCSPYVAKAVARGQILHSLEIFSECIRKEYTVMLSYLAGARSNWEHVNLGKHCTDVKYFLPLSDGDYYDALMNSYVQADDEKIRHALDLLMSKYHLLAAAVGDILGYTYDSLEGEKTIQFIKGEFESKKAKCEENS